MCKHKQALASDDPRHSSTGEKKDPASGILSDFSAIARSTSIILPPPEMFQLSPIVHVKLISIEAA